MTSDEREGAPEIALIGDLTDNESDITARLLEVPFGESCIVYIDSPGGSPYSGLALMTLIQLRGLNVTGIVTGECSSAALWPLAACKRRLVTPYSVLLFHPMKWQSEEHIGLAEAAEWARHFAQLETEMDHVLTDLFGLRPADVERWMRPGRYVSGRELAEAGLAELVELKALPALGRQTLASRKKPRSRQK